MTDAGTPPRGTLPVRIFRLGAEPRDDLTAVTTPEERLEMVLTHSRSMWELTGRPFPSYTRATMPVRIIRPA
ncbi:MAG: hypothetical protein NW201_13300 [Gemmatimonadales bacterium]|nr:hypothetical protein [Gemmatimonadales bacterium]